MIFTAITAGGEQFALGAPLSCCINREEGVPADDMTVVFPYETDIAQLAYIFVHNQKEAVFTGVVDEQSFLCSESGGLVTVCARSMAALLLDNEALPQAYHAPNAQTVFLRHIQPLGIARYTCEKKEKSADLTVSKGMTHWQVLENFCKLCLGTYPSVDGQGGVHMCGCQNTKKALVFDNGGDGIRFTEIKTSVKRCKRLSQVYVKTSVTDEYSMPVNNPDALAKGIIRRRYLNASDLSEKTVSYADKMIQDGEYASFYITLSCPQALTGCMGQRAVIVYGGKRYDGLYVSKVQYTYTENSEKTVVTFLKCREG